MTGLELDSCGYKTTLNKYHMFLPFQPLLSVYILIILSGCCCLCVCLFVSLAPSAPLNVAVVRSGVKDLLCTWDTPSSPNGVISNYIVGLHILFKLCMIIYSVPKGYDSLYPIRVRLKVFLYALHYSSQTPNLFFFIFFILTI